MNSKKDKKSNKVTFVLTPRPQKDPLAADLDAPQNVLVPKDGQDLDKIKALLPDFQPEMFPSENETKLGMLERAQQPDGALFDTDLLKAMSQDFEYDDPNNLLDDDFVLQAGQPLEDDQGDFEEFDFSEMNDDDESERMHDFEKFKSPLPIQKKSEGDCDDDIDDDEDDRKTVFTNYSMSSSVIRRNQGLQQIDEHFERLYTKEYADETEVGALDLNDVKGEELLTSIDQIKALKKEVKVVRMRNHGNDYKPEIVSDHHKDAIIGSDPEADENDLVEVAIEERLQRVDCESVLSRTSTLYNHPKLIMEPRRAKRSRTSSMTSDAMEVDEQPQPSIRAQSIASSRASRISQLSNRPKDETPTDRRARKKALREYRQERRLERKQNQQIFKTEKARLQMQEKTKQATLKLT